MALPKDIANIGSIANAVYNSITANTTAITLINLANATFNNITANTSLTASAIDINTGTNIASAATINLNTATGNRVHITGTTTITAVTLTRGPRTVIFDGILTLTHHTTNNNLPGAANITTAAGDRAIYESDGTTVYCVSYIKVSGAAVVTASSAVNYPQSIKSADYTLVLADAGYQIFHPATDTAARIFTIPSNASVAYPIGTVLVFVNEIGAQQVTVAITTDTLADMRGVTGSKRVGANNILTALKITATRWMCWFADDDVAKKQFLAVVHGTTPFVTAYAWSSAGFGDKFANPVSLPSIAMGTVPTGVSFSPAGTELALSHATSPFVTAYPWSSSGFGTKFANPATLPTGSGECITFSPAGTEIVVGHSTLPFVTAYRWSSDGFGTKFADPSTAPDVIQMSAAISPAGTELVMGAGGGGGGFIGAWRWSTSGFGSKFSNPATMPAGTGESISFSPSGTEVACAHGTSPFVTAYPWSSAGFGVKFANPATLPTGYGYGAAFSPAGTELAISHGVSPFVSVYPWSSAGFGVKFANPATLPVGNGESVSFSPTGTEIAIVYGSTPFVSAYPWSYAGFGVKFGNPATVPTGVGCGVAFTQL